MSFDGGTRCAFVTLRKHTKKFGEFTLAFISRYKPFRRAFRARSAFDRSVTTTASRITFSPHAKRPTKSGFNFCLWKRRMYDDFTTKSEKEFVQKKLKECRIELVLQFTS